MWLRNIANAWSCRFSTWVVSFKPDVSGISKQQMKGGHVIEFHFIKRTIFKQQMRGSHSIELHFIKRTMLPLD